MVALSRIFKIHITIDCIVLVHITDSQCMHLSHILCSSKCGIIPFVGVLCIRANNRKITYSLQHMHFKVD